MTEVWKSQGRKYCEFCDCWFADNKVSFVGLLAFRLSLFTFIFSQRQRRFYILYLHPTLNQVSISFHENGKRHKESVEKKVKEIQKKGSEREKKENDEKKFLEMMEKGAAEAIEKDIKQDPR